MATLLDHLLKLTDHRDRDHLELTLSKALIDLLPIERVVMARVLSEEGSRRWLEIASLDARGGGKLIDPLWVDFGALRSVDDDKSRLQCLQSQAKVELAWAGEEGPRITYLPLFADNPDDDEGVVEIHSGAVLKPEQQATTDALLHVFRNMYRLLAYSDRDALTGLLNRKALDDTFYSAVLEELGESIQAQQAAPAPTDASGQERRHRVPPNYWLGSVSVDGFDQINDKYGNLVAEDVLLLVARIMRNTFRTYDRLYRLGGDKFAVLMHCPEEALVLAAFERFRVNVEKFKTAQVGSVTICAGFSRVSAEDSPDSTLARAERAVDFCQSSGANQVASHGELVRRGLFTP